MTFPAGPLESAVVDNDDGYPIASRGAPADRAMTNNNTCEIALNLIANRSAIALASNHQDSPFFLQTETPGHSVN